MKFAFVIGVLLVLWYILDTPERRRKQAEKRRVLQITSSDKTISFTELAFMRNDLTTARSMIKLGLVKYKFGGATEMHLQNFFENQRKYTSEETKTLMKFGLLPESSTYVGISPHDAECKISR